MKVIITLFVLFFILNNFTKADDFEYPQNLNFGDINLIEKNWKGFQSYWPLFNGHLKIKNISNDTIDLISFTLNSLYDTIIRKKNYVKISENYQNNVTVYPGEDFYLPLSVYADFIDSVSSAGEFLRSELQITYHKFYSDYYDTISVDVLFRVVNKKILSLKKWDVKKDCNCFLEDFGKNKIPNSNTAAFLYNFSGRSVTIDSINYRLIGKNITKVEIYDNEYSLTSLPLIIDDNSIGGISFIVEAIVPEESKVLFSIYGHFDDNYESFEFSDTASHKFITQKNFQFIYNQLNKQYLEVGETTKNFLRSRLFLYKSEKWTLKSVDYSSPPNSFLEVIPYTTIPITLDSISNTYLTSVQFQSFSEGLNLIKIFMNFESESGIKLVYPYIYIINVIKPLDVHEQKEQRHPFSISPNPAGEYIEIALSSPRLKPWVTGVDAIKIFNLLGECMINESIHPMTPSHRMNIESLPAGLYFVRVGDWVGRFVKY